MFPDAHTTRGPSAGPPPQTCPPPVSTTHKSPQLTNLTGSLVPSGRRVFAAEERGRRQEHVLRLPLQVSAPFPALLRRSARSC